MCKCIEEVQNSVKELHNYNLVELDCILTDLGTQKSLTGQRIDISYNKVKRGGVIQRMYKKSYVSHTFCPFCGVKY
jgi:hypothetical protein